MPSVELIKLFFFYQQLVEYDFVSVHLGGQGWWWRGKIEGSPAHVEIVMEPDVY